MGFGSRVKKAVAPEKLQSEDHTHDPTAWLINSELANFLLMNTDAIRYMCMLGYTYLHGCKLFDKLPEHSTLSYRFVSMILQCTGGGILVPIFVNAIPVPLSQDAYPIAVAVAFLLHQYVPMLRKVWHESLLFHVFVVVLFETLRASVVVKLTAHAGKVIPPSDFGNVAVFGPIFCGAIAGCGGSFLPLNKGLSPLEKTGLAQPMISALIGATFYHLFVNTSLSANVIDAPKKAHILVTLFFIGHHLFTLLETAATGILLEPKKPLVMVEQKKEQ